MNTLRFLRLERGLTQPDLARQSGLQQAIISYIETGRVVPTVAELEALARVLGVSPNVLPRPVEPDLREDGVACAPPK